MPLASHGHRTEKGAARVHALAGTAADLFLERGYESVSLDTLIAEVGGSRRNIYRHFGGKEGLFVEAISRLCSEISDPLLHLEIDDKDTPSALTEFGRQVLEIVLQPRVLSLHRLMVAEGQRFPDLAQAIWRSGHDSAIRVLADWIRTRPQGEFRAGADADALAAQFVGMVVTGPQLRALVGLDDQPSDKAAIATHVEQAVDVFLSGARKRDD